MPEVVALFATRREAEGAIDSLEARGYDASSVGYLDRPHDTEVETEGDAAEEAGKGATGGAVGGAAVGAGSGLLASAGLAVVPGMGPFLAAGTLLGTLGATAAGAAGGAVLGGVAGAIFGGDDDERATYYRAGVEEGGSLVTVSASAGDSAEIKTVLRDLGARKVDIHDDTGWVV